MVMVNSALTIHYLGDFAVIIIVLGKEAEVFFHVKILETLCHKGSDTLLPIRLQSVTIFIVGV